MEGGKRGSLVSLFPDLTRASSEAGGWGSGEERGGGGRMGGYPIVTIEEATVDGYDRCVGDDEGDEDGRMPVHAEKCGLKNTLFGAWRNVMWRMVSLFILYRSRLVSRVLWSTPTKLILVDFKAYWKVHRHLAL